MADANFPKLLNALIVITLFSFLLAGFLIGLGQNYGVETAEVSDRIGFDLINDSLTSTHTTSSQWQSTFEDIGEGGIFDALLDIVGFLTVGMFRLLVDMFDFILIPFEIFGTMLTTVLGVPVIVANIINVLIILTIIFGVWSLIKRGV